MKVMIIEIKNIFITRPDEEASFASGDLWLVLI